jgi:hypothetical protein
MIRVLERLKHREPAGVQRTSQKHQRSDECAQARQNARIQSGAASASAAPATTCEAERESIQQDGGARRLVRLWWFVERSDDTW